MDKIRNSIVSCLRFSYILRLTFLFEKLEYVLVDNVSTRHADVHDIRNVIFDKGRYMKVYY